jgi:two-component system, OmpR family, sensor histidine kinase KdpD
VRLQTNPQIKMRHSTIKGFFWGIIVPTLCTLIVWPLKNTIGPASILMTYLLGVFLVASRYGRNASIVASLLSAPAFAFYYARPYFSFAIHDLENVIGLVVMLVVANVTGRLLEKSQFQTELAEERVNRANALYRLSQDLSGTQDQQSIAAIARFHIHDNFMAQSELIVPDCENRLRCQTNKSLTNLALPLEQEIALNAFDSGNTKYEGNLIYYPLKGSTTKQGILVIQAVKPLTSSIPEMMTFIDTFCHLIAQALERLTLAVQAKEAAFQAESESLRNALLSSISHDLRTPLTRIVGATSTLLERYAETPLSEHQDLQLVLDEARRMSELTDKLLDMAKLSCGQIMLHRDWNVIEEIVGSALNRLDKSLQDRPVRTLLPDNLPLLWVDEVLLEQVLVNLIENAIKYTPPGKAIDIEAGAMSNCIRLTVTDYGPGIANDQLPKLFDKFFRGNPESVQSGVGLGLALCKAIIEAHGGIIQATNCPGKGAEFRIDLPLKLEPSMPMI